MSRQSKVSEEVRIFIVSEYNKGIKIEKIEDDVYKKFGVKISDALVSAIAHQEGCKRRVYRNSFKYKTKSKREEFVDQVVSSEETKDLDLIRLILKTNLNPEMKIRVLSRLNL